MPSWIQIGRPIPLHAARLGCFFCWSIYVLLQSECVFMMFNKAILAVLHYESLSVFLIAYSVHTDWRIAWAFMYTGANIFWFGRLHHKLSWLLSIWGSIASFRLPEHAQWWCVALVNLLMGRWIVSVCNNEEYVQYGHSLHYGFDT